MSDVLTQEELDALLSQMSGGDDEPDDEPPPQAKAKIEPTPVNRPKEPVAPVPVRGDNLEVILELPLTLRVEVGRTRLKVADLLQLGQGVILELNRMADDQLDLTVNGRVVARGDAVVVNENFGFRVTEVDSVRERIKKL